MSDAYEFSTFRSERDNSPRAGLHSWPELVGMLRNVHRCKCTLDTCGKGEHEYLDRNGKSKGCRHKYIGAWSPASYAAGRTRGLANVERVSVAVFDHDHITDDQICEIEGRLRRHRHILHATHGDRPGDRRIRSVIPLSRPVEGSRWPQFWPALVAKLELPGVDRQASDASRLYFMPSRPSDAPYFFHMSEAQ